MVEFALIAVLFFAMLSVVIQTAWYAFEVSAITSGARNAARWEIATSQYQLVSNGQIVNSGGSPEPWCAVTPPGNIPPKLVSQANSTAGPFANAINATTITNTPVYQVPSDNTSPIVGCTLTIKVAYTPVIPLIPIGGPYIVSSFTAHTD
jgi:hypothetical protein